MRRVSLSAVAAAALALAACAGPDRAAPPSSPAAETAVWGDRTIAMTYKEGDPLVAYFAPGQGAGRIFVWDGGETAIAQGDWRLDGARLCMTLAVFRRESPARPPLRAREPVCIRVDDPMIVGRSYRGDVFSLRDLTSAPYILSQADNERLVTVLHDAERTGR